MPLVEEDQLGELVLSGNIGAVSLDTTAFDRYQCNLNAQALRNRFHLAARQLQQGFLILAYGVISFPQFSYNALVSIEIMSL